MSVPNGTHEAKIPSSRKWSRLGLSGTAWGCGPISVLSTLDYAKLPKSEAIGPQWHISITAMGKRPKPHHVRKALRAFGMADAEEDNHHPGNARHFFLPVDPAARVTCDCKEDEVEVVEADGYTWQNDPADCRGCEFEDVLGRPCPVHALKGAST